MTSHTAISHFLCEIGEVNSLTASFAPLSKPFQGAEEFGWSGFKFSVRNSRRVQIGKGFTLLIMGGSPSPPGARSAPLEPKPK
jgi:hypothetical protein